MCTSIIALNYMVTSLSDSAHVMLTLPHFLPQTETKDDRGGLQRSSGQESPGQVQVSFTDSVEIILNNVSCHMCQR